MPPWAPWESPVVLGGLGTVLVGCGGVLAQDEDLPSLQRQQTQGWNVGNENLVLRFPFATDLDVSGGHGWRDFMDRLPESLSPHSSRWAPYYAPTLFQVLQSPLGASLRDVTRPIATPEMLLAHQRAAALASLFGSKSRCPSDIAVVVDLAGPESVAVGAALASCLEPVFFFDNWPHPVGVVPSHLTLAATLYYWPLFHRQLADRPADPAPVFILDRARLTPYVDEITRFDNRYLARLPSAGALGVAGIRHVLYVVDSANPPLESDDLNDDFVAFSRSGIDVRMIPLDAFLPEPGHGEGDLAMRGPSATAPLFFAGSRAEHAHVFAWYGWESVADGSAGSPSHLDSWPPSVMRAWAYRPEPRPTMFCDDVGDCPPVPRFTGAGGFAGSYRSGTIARLGSGHGFG